jgi:hypothetical protein
MEMNISQVMHIREPVLMAIRCRTDREKYPSCFNFAPKPSVKIKYDRFKTDDFEARNKIRKIRMKDFTAGNKKQKVTRKKTGRTN